MGKYEFEIVDGPDEWVAQLNDNQLAIVYVEELDDGKWWVAVSARPHLEPETEDWVREGVDKMLDRLFDVGDPERIGWFPSKLNPGRWFQVLAAYELPDMSFLENPGDGADEH